MNFQPDEEGTVSRVDASWQRTTGRNKLAATDMPNL